MFVVALLALSSSPEDEAQKLAADLGVTAFEAGQLVRGALPSILLRTAEKERAGALLAKLRARGHEVAALDTEAITPLEQMHELRDFRLEDDALVSVSPNGTSERLGWGDVVALVRATHKGSGTKTEKKTERQFSVGKALLTSGLSMTKKVTTETSQKVEQKEPVLYLFRRTGTPWCTSEGRCRYEGLGAQLKPSRLENFNTLVRLLRERLPQVPFDDRLTHPRSGGDRLQVDGKGVQTSSSNASAVDLLAHVVAISLVKRPGA